jgi:hypothetical protein
LRPPLGDQLRQLVVEVVDRLRGSPPRAVAAYSSEAFIDRAVETRFQAVACRRS